MNIHKACRQTALALLLAASMGQASAHSNAADLSVLSG